MRLRGRAEDVDVVVLPDKYHRIKDAVALEGRGVGLSGSEFVPTARLSLGIMR